MKYNKEYIEQLLQRFMDGETTEQEEQFLAEYFSTSDSIPEEWEAYREMFASFSTDAYDFSEEELIGAERPTPTSMVFTPPPSPPFSGEGNPVREGDLIPPKHRIIKILPWLAAACIAALMVVVLAPPREDASLNSGGNVIAEVKTDSMNKEQQRPEPITTTDKQIAQATEHKTLSVQEQSQVSSVSKKKATATSQETTRQEPTAPVSTDLALSDIHYTTSSNENSNSLPIGEGRGEAAWDEAIEQEFRTTSAPIRMRGQQVIQRVAMMQSAHRNQPQYVEL